MFQTNIIMTQDQINCLHNTKYELLVLLKRKLCQIMEWLRPKTRNPLEIFLVSLCYYYYYFIFIIFQINLIMTHDQINCLRNTKEES